ncbi:hypothetical protein ASD62_02810 [Phycicoccus sp. Root563]|uniref:hypothetical protein n=1 Tax=unclassified Phycicoccus TaxID=2637926 RepID=UPI000702DBD9|nr:MULTISPECIES: hypothetical protein [unclassified Phycicoccus]KQU68930.1 hypothetical protein ASC58_09740 [Phycicoccus sp. Root101]KQZ88408.1 hypothetical protein ASD62_02810 [Phycicoccus sp. Root563]
MKVRDAVRLGYGFLLLTRPERVARVLTGGGLDRRARVTARILGGRHIAQALLVARDGRAAVRRVGRAVDLLHAASMLLLAAWAPDRTRTAMADAAVATLFAGPSSPTEDNSNALAPRRRPATRTPQPLLDLPAPPHPKGVLPIADRGLTGGAALRRRHRHERQDALREVLAKSPGLNLAQTRAALVSALEARGLGVPPEPWLEAAAIDLVNGNIYVVNGPAMQDTGLELPPHGPT